MSASFSERQNYTADQVKAHIDAAIVVAQRDNVPDDLRVPVFTEALRLLSAKQVILQQGPPIQLGTMLGGDRMRG